MAEIYPPMTTFRLTPWQSILTTVFNRRAQSILTSLRKQLFYYLGSQAHPVNSPCSVSSVAPSGLRGELRLWREGPPRTCWPAFPFPTNRAVLFCLRGCVTLEHPSIVQEIAHFYGVGLGRYLVRVGTLATSPTARRFLPRRRGDRVGWSRFARSQFRGAHSTAPPPRSGELRRWQQQNLHGNSPCNIIC